jgi:8-oxo-dGTP pyrophosphatase MutT (NUDIX family)
MRARGVLATSAAFALPTHRFVPWSRSLTRTRTVLSSTSAETPPLPFGDLPYRGACVQAGDAQQLDDAGFVESLGKLIPWLQGKNYNSAWISVPTERSALCAQASSAYGFELHHIDAESGGNIMMKKWLREGVEDKVPPYPFTQLGSAGFVLNDENEILLVKEWQGNPGNRTPSESWKLPGGLIDRGESFHEAAVREVFEETGVETESEALLTMWHRHGLTFGISDIYVVCLLKPKPDSVIKPDPVEISAARWMKVSEFCKTQRHPLITRILKTCFSLPVDTIASSPPGSAEDVLLRSDDDYARGERLRPRVVMKEHSVQFGQRPAIPTFVGVAEKSKGPCEDF